MKIDKSKNYEVTFVQWLDKDTIIEIVSGKLFFRLRNFFSDLGYEVKDIKELQYNINKK